MIISISGAAIYQNVSRQAIYFAIRQKKLKAQKNIQNKKWEISLNDLMEYKNSKWSRKKSIYQDGPLYDETKGELSVNEAAINLGIPIQRVYYSLRTGQLKGFRKNHTWVIKKEDLKDYNPRRTHKQSSMCKRLMNKIA